MVKYLCDFCGGFEVSDEEYQKTLGLGEFELPPTTDVAGFVFQVKGMGGRPDINQIFCAWCMHGALRVALGVSPRVPAGFIAPPVQAGNIQYSSPDGEGG